MGKEFSREEQKDVLEHLCCDAPTTSASCFLRIMPRSKTHFWSISSVNGLVMFSSFSVSCFNLMVSSLLVFSILDFLLLFSRLFSCSLISAPVSPCQSCHSHLCSVALLYKQSLSPFGSVWLLFLLGCLICFILVFCIFVQVKSVF